MCAHHQLQHPRWKIYYVELDPHTLSLGSLLFGYELTAQLQPCDAPLQRPVFLTQGCLCGPEFLFLSPPLTSQVSICGFQVHKLDQLHD